MTKPLEGFQQEIETLFNGKYDEATGGIETRNDVPNEVLRQTALEVERPDRVYASEFQRHAGESRNSHEDRLREEVEELKRSTHVPLAKEQEFDARAAFDKWYEEYPDTTPYEEGMFDSFKAGYAAGKRAGFTEGANRRSARIAEQEGYAAGRSVGGAAVGSLSEEQVLTAINETDKEIGDTMKVLNGGEYHGLGV